MGKIALISQAPSPALTDFLVGTSAADSKTYSFTISQLAALMAKSKGQFYDSVNQTATNANTAYAVILRGVDSSATSGISVVTDGTNLTRITVTNTGTYLVCCSAAIRTSTNAVVDMWLRKNGVTVASNLSNTNRKMNALLATSNNYMMYQTMVSLTAGDYIQLVWASDVTGTLFQADSVNTFHAESPSVTASIIQI